MEIRIRKDNSINGNCSKCGSCCANVLMLSEVEINNIRKYISTHNIKAVNRNTIFEFVNICPFLNKQKECNIYEVRPEICRNFSCQEGKDLLDYTKVRAIDMISTFYPNEFSEKPDLTNINNRIKELQKKIKSGRK